MGEVRPDFFGKGFGDYSMLGAAKTGRKGTAAIMIFQWMFQTTFVGHSAWMYFVITVTHVTAPTFAANFPFSLNDGMSCVTHLQRMEKK